MKYEHRFRVRASLAAVVGFHSRAASMPAITPPPIIVRVHGAPPVLGDGDVMDFTMWAGPLPMRWVAQIEDISDGGFTDRQVQGPFACWQHRHSFVPIADNLIEVVDQVEAGVKKHVFWGPVGMAMWIGLPLLFAYRGRKTRRLVEAGGTSMLDMVSSDPVSGSGPD
jgi:ligand-binding SRPBCC domain-containing protein